MNNLFSVFENLFSRAGINMNALREGVVVFILRLLNVGLTFFSTVLLSRLLGVNGYGIYAYAYAFVMLIALPAEAGLPQLVLRETARGMAENRLDIVKGVWRWSGKLVGIFAIIFAVIVGTIIFLQRDEMKSQNNLTLGWALILVPLMALGNLRGAGLQGMKRVIVGQLPEFVIRPGGFFLLLAYLILVGRQILPSFAMMLNVIAAAIAFIVGAWILSKNIPYEIKTVTPYRESRSWLKSSFLFALIAGFGVINNQASTVILGLFKSPVDVGIYRVALQVSMLASLGLQTINMMVAPRFANLYAQGKLEQLQHLVTTVARVALVLNLIFTIIFILVGKIFFELVFGVDFVASYFPLIILLGGQVLNSMTGPVGYLLNMTGHEGDTVIGLGVSAGAVIILNVLFISLWSTHGAAFASTISMIIWNVLLWWKVKQRLGISSLAFMCPTQ